MIPWSQYLQPFIALVLLSATALGAPIGSASTDGPQLQRRGTCDHPLSFYSRSHYKISVVRIVSPFDYLGTVRKLTNDALASTTLHAGDDFSSESVTRARRAIRERLNQEGNAINLPVMVNVVSAAIENCSADAQPPSLEVVYEAFSTWAPFVFTPTFEYQSSQSDDPATASGVRHKKLELVPRVGYDATARVFGGGRASIANRMVKFDLDASASSQMLSGAASLSGKHTWENGWIRTAEWQTGSYYDDIPTGI